MWSRARNPTRALIPRTPRPEASIPDGIAAPAALLGWFFEPVLGIGLGFAGGAMIYLVMAEMLPEAIEEGGKTLTAWGVMVGLCTMLMVTNLINLLPIPQ